jgi:hypothetical protein
MAWRTSRPSSASTYPEPRIACPLACPLALLWPFGPANEKKQTRLRAEDIEKIVSTVVTFKSVAKYAHRAKRSEIEANECNLNIPRYVDTSEAEEAFAIAGLQLEIVELEMELAKTQVEMKKHLAGLGIFQSSESTTVVSLKKMLNLCQSATAVEVAHGLNGKSYDEGIPQLGDCPAGWQKREA